MNNINVYNLQCSVLTFLIVGVCTYLYVLAIQCVRTIKYFLIKLSEKNNMQKYEIRCHSLLLILFKFIANQVINIFCLLRPTTATRPARNYTGSHIRSSVNRWQVCFDDVSVFFFHKLFENKCNIKNQLLSSSGSRIELLSFISALLKF